MQSTSIEIGDIFKRFGDQLSGLLPEQYKVAKAVRDCRTSALGGHQLKCNQCNYHKILYNSCSNRHCPKCQFLTKVKWVEKRKEDLLPCQYFHVVFTIPSELRALFLRNKELCYGLLFKTSSETLKEVAAKPKNLGADIGFIGVLHTWGQNLVDHPHVHYVVPGGGLNKDKNKWIKSRDSYFLNVGILSTVFKAKMLKALRESFDRDEIQFRGQIEHLSNYFVFNELLMNIYSKSWVVYSKKPFAGPEQVINYLGNYTHRIAISNYRLVKLEGDRVFFKVRNNEKQGESKVISLHVNEFMRRFLLHVLPKGFVRIRHFGLLGNRYRKEKIALIRMIEKIVVSLVNQSEQSWQEILKKIIGKDLSCCPKCEKGKLVAFADVKAVTNSS